MDGENFRNLPRLPEPDDLAAPGRAAAVDKSHVATREDLLATILAGLLVLPRGKVALLEARFTDELLAVLAPDVKEPASMLGPKPEPVGSPLVVAANLIVADTAATSCERAASELLRTLQAADAVGCAIMPCLGDADEDPCSSRGAVLVIIPTASLDKP